jgi:short-subunit dehydrogenase
MESLKGRKAILTGASGGIGVPLAEALAGEGMDLLLVAHPGAGLPELAASLGRHGIRSSVLVADLRDASQYAGVVERAVAEFGRVDVLVNNAGVEFSLRYDQLTETQIRQVITVNLEAPMMLSRLVLPGMLARRTGHIVNLSSLAGKSGPAFQEPYAATKAALTAFTFSLRASYRGTGVSASVVCPGFVEAGIYSRLKERSGATAPALLAGCPPHTVARAVLRALRGDVAEILVNRYPLRPALALATLSPAFGAWLTRWLGVNEFFRRVVEANARSTKAE